MSLQKNGSPINNTKASAHIRLCSWLQGLQVMVTHCHQRPNTHTHTLPCTHIRMRTDTRTNIHCSTCTPRWGAWGAIHSSTCTPKRRKQHVVKMAQSVQALPLLCSSSKVKRPVMKRDKGPEVSRIWVVESHEDGIEYHDRLPTEKGDEGWFLPPCDAGVDWVHCLRARVHGRGYYGYYTTYTIL